MVVKYVPGAKLSGPDVGALPQTNFAAYWNWNDWAWARVGARVGMASRKRTRTALRMTGSPYRHSDGPVARVSLHLLSHRDALQVQVRAAVRRDRCVGPDH